MSKYLFPTFRDAVKDLKQRDPQFGQAYPTFRASGSRQSGTMVKTVDELDKFLGNDRAPSDWDVYAQLAQAAAEDMKFHRLDRAGEVLTASQQRQKDHLEGVALTALERAESLYLQHAEIRAAETGQAGAQFARDGEWSATAHLGRERDHKANGRHAWIRTHDDRPATVARGQRFADHDVVSAHAHNRAGSDAAVIGQHGSLGQLVRAMTTTSGSAVVPTVWSGDLIDRARNMAAVLQAGAEIVPMDAKTVQIGRLTGDPTAAFRTEGSAITASDPTFDNVTLEAKTMSALVVGSLEWFQDADNVDEVVSQAIAQAIALKLDEVGLYGSITTGAGTINLPTPPNPRGVLGALNALAASSVLGGETDGTAQTALSYYNELLDLIYTPRLYNEEPTAMIHNAKLGLQYAKAYDSTGQPLQAPEPVRAIPAFVTNQVPSYTQGTMTDRATDVFVGDWSQLLIGQRLDITIQTLVERYAENGQIGIVAHWRGDVAVARARAFAAYKALQGSA